MQDGGLPHIGCRCRQCSAAEDDPFLAEYVACLAIVDMRQQPTGVWLVDATPDIKSQLSMLSAALGPNPMWPERLRQPTGLFLTHAHMGHTGGLLQFGPETMAASNLPVHASAELIKVLEQSRLWQPAISMFELTEISPNLPINLAEDLTITPIPVPHRDELGAGTFGYHIVGPASSLFYVPDIDSWGAWPEATDVLAKAQIAMVDGSFFSLDELPGREPIAHPLMPDTIGFFAEINAQLWFTHLNHTNPALDKESQARYLLQLAGGRVARTGQVFEL
jgi:pyrroloquinoline quinone biosynthesis protein B